MTSPSAEYVVVNEQIRIPLAELRFLFSRSSGPGGQNVNKVSTRVTLLFDLAATTALTPGQRARVRRRLASRTDGDGVLRVVCGTQRTQGGNRREAISRLAALLAEALTERKPRYKTRVSRSAIRRRLEDKRRRSQLKRQRSGRPGAND